MKTSIIKNISLLGLLLFLFASCEKDEVKLIANSQGTAGTIATSTNSLELQEDNASSEAITFTWTKADFGYSAALTNTLQFALARTNFAEPKEVVLVGGTSSLSYTVQEFNTFLLAMDVPAGTNSTLEVRVKSEIFNTDDITPVYSNVVNLSVTPYSTAPVVSFVYVPGAYQGWNPASADSLISPASDGIYTGVINFPAGGLEFKITPAKNWDTAYGDAGNGTVNTSGGNLLVPSAGMYRLTLNLNDNTFTADKYSWGVIGSATAGGWDSDTDMTYNNGTQEWTLTTNLVAGEIKFRLNDDWGTNYGGAGGTLALGGDNIAIATAGTYKITFSLATNTYSVVMQ
ncbi:MAG: DUF5116 domain-containing protein [Cytophagales bacterium CG18_big_fil_WC_8_21_14_2_50_42_9]|nr:MAG: DUF5116 domain-containing protein [Cytophagales bacterium CG18_big_fil_WC_8_21_14_2_50_42_9]